MIPASKVESVYSKVFGVRWWEKLIPLIGPNFNIGDAEYNEVDWDEVQKVLYSDEIQSWKYEAEEFDCDDFAFALMGAFHHNRKTAAMPIFITWVRMPEGGHAVVSILLDEEVYIIEPQNDKIFVPPNSWKLMMICG